ncbi:hypothetical protein [Nocardiopsis alba]|uniref:hypothetical protein n=1 Tax=Nocardiopsis alba TaxID=53437 RepID=UPI0035D974A6
MSGYHGTVGATGVRPSVCPEPLRRALLLAGLVMGILFTVWLASGSAQAEELPLAEPAPPAGPSVVEGAETLGGSIGDTVTAVGERATRTVEDASRAARAVENEASEPVRTVHDTVRAASTPSVEGLPESLAPLTGPVSDPAPARSEDPVEVEETTETEERTLPTEGTTEPETIEAPEPPEALVAAVAPAGDDVVHDEGDDSHEVVEDGLDRISAGAGAPATAPAPASGGTATGPAVAGFLNAVSAPAPMPGLFEAARHVLRSAPAESTDEPTFSPD